MSSVRSSGRRREEGEGIFRKGCENGSGAGMPYGLRSPIMVGVGRRGKERAMLGIRGT
jgi:hypothetical protein